MTPLKRARNSEMLSAEVQPDLDVTRWEKISGDLKYRDRLAVVLLDLICMPICVALKAQKGEIVYSKGSCGLLLLYSRLYC